MTPLEPDRGQLEMFIDALLRHRGEEGYISLRSFDNNNQVLKPIQTVKLKDAKYSFLVDVDEDQARRAANNPRPTVFCPPLCVLAEGWRAREKDLLKGLVLSVECDKHPEEARCKLQEVLGEATAIVRSGGQWLNPDDGVSNIPAVHCLRWPGSWHAKARPGCAKSCPSIRTRRSTSTRR